MNTAIRVQQLCSQMSELELDAMLVMGYPNYRYLSGFTGSNAVLLIHPQRKLLVTDFRYQEQSAKQAIGFDIEVVIKAGAGLSGPVEKAVSELNIHRLGYESDHMTVAAYRFWKECLTSVELVPCDGEIERIRQIKDEDEIKLIARAQQISESALDRLIPLLRPGITEREIAAELTYQMAKEGCTPAFDHIIASGPNSSMPHAGVSERVIQNGDFLTMDFGACYCGYCSDMTRTLAIGQPTPKMREVYEIVLQAQQASLDLLGPGVSCREIDAAAREIIAKAGYADCFGHGLGHGFGMEIHEQPRCNQTTTERLHPGICTSVEPGIYLPGEFGVRIEDIVVITENGYKNFTTAQKNLIIL